ncbi:MAG: hypothetical protein CM1200mP24_03650 [Gammaproteobacteria bacterium]|nr:MAG: hypothetical protein CM1200mP24_03650 [Gammaproteobacteria bacterium]
MARRFGRTPIFNWFFVPLMCFLACALSIAPVSRWKKTPLQFFKWAALTAIGSIFLGVLLPLLFGGKLHIGVFVGVSPRLLDCFESGR